MLTLSFMSDHPAPPGVDTRDRWRTPAVLIRAIEFREGRRFDLDACAEAGAHHATRWIGVEDDALRTDWIDRAGGVERPLCWCNPPFSRKGEFLARSWDMALRGAVVWIILPARPDGDLPLYADRADVMAIPSRRIAFIPPPELGIEAGGTDSTGHLLLRFVPFGHRDEVTGTRVVWL